MERTRSTRTVKDRKAQVPYAEFMDHPDRACKGADYDVFFMPEGDYAETRAWTDGPAKELCSVCPVEGECLKFAVAHRIPFGIWGCKTPEERRVIANREERS